MCFYYRLKFITKTLTVCSECHLLCRNGWGDNKSRSYISRRDDITKCYVCTNKILDVRIPDLIFPAPDVELLFKLTIIEERMISGIIPYQNIYFMSNVAFAHKNVISFR